MNTYKIRNKDLMTIKKAINAVAPKHWSKEVGYRNNFDLNLDTFNLLLAPLADSDNNTDLISPYHINELKNAEVELRDDSDVIKIDVYLHSRSFEGDYELEYNVYVYFDTSTGEAHTGKYEEML
jgi:hypothetical protein